MVYWVSKEDIYLSALVYEICLYAEEGVTTLNLICMFLSSSDISYSYLIGIIINTFLKNHHHFFPLGRSLASSLLLVRCNLPGENIRHTFWRGEYWQLPHSGSLDYEWALFRFVDAPDLYFWFQNTREHVKSDLKAKTLSQTIVPFNSFEYFHFSSEPVIKTALW